MDASDRPVSAVDSATATPPAGGTAGRRLPGFAVTVLGVGLFLFIPLVLYLFVGQPRIGGGLGWPLGLGVTVMLGHRFLARPYMHRVRRRKCLWCNRVPPRRPAAVELATGGGPLEAAACGQHAGRVRRFFAFAHAWRRVLRLGIFVPLLLLLATLAAVAAGSALPGLGLATVTDAFRLAVGLTVNLAAWGYLAVPDPPSGEPARVPFPAHNFFLLGLGPLLWVFRGVGVWWIWIGARGLLGG